METISGKTSKKILSKIRHDLTNPINVIIGYSELLLDIVGEYVPSLREDILNILKSGEALLLDTKNIFSIDTKLAIFKKTLIIHPI